MIFSTACEHFKQWLGRAVPETANGRDDLCRPVFRKSTLRQGMELGDEIDPARRSIGFPPRRRDKLVESSARSRHNDPCRISGRKIRIHFNISLDRYLFGQFHGLTMMKAVGRQWHQRIFAKGCGDGHTIRNTVLRVFRCRRIGEVVEAFLLT